MPNTGAHGLTLSRSNAKADDEVCRPDLDRAMRHSLVDRSAKRVIAIRVDNHHGLDLAPEVRSLVSIPILCRCAIT